MTRTINRRDLRGLYPPVRSPRVQMLDMEGNVLKEYRSAHDAHISSLLGYRGIRDCCEGKRESFAGFRWRFVTQ